MDERESLPKPKSMSSLPDRKNIFRKASTTFLVGLSLVALTACGPTDPNTRPTDSQLKDAISLLVKNFSTKHPDLVDWKIAEVNKQLSEPLPKGFSTEAGYYLKWNDYAEGAFPEVYVPWDLIGQYPNKFQREVTSYPPDAGSNVPASVLQAIRHDQVKNLAGDPYFAAIVGVRYSKINPKWIIFTSIPLLPVTDHAYGWASVKNGSWRVTDFGTATVGCGVVPDSVQKEFGFGCPTLK